MKRWLYSHGVSMHAQNLNERQGEPDGPMWQYGRAWIYGFDGDGDTGEGWRKTWELNPEWHIEPQASAGIGLHIGGDSHHEVMLSLDLALARFYLSFEAPWLTNHLRRIQPFHMWDSHQVIEQYRPRDRERYVKLYDPVEVEVRWHDGGLWWAFWMHPHEWNSSDPKWRRGHFHPVDFLLGRRQYESVEIGTEDIEVPMPEKSYPAVVKLKRDTWRRAHWPYWPFTRTLRRADIEVEGGIPHPGKGENAWDCGDDATCSLYCVARTAEEAVGKFVASVLRSRRKYGGHNWRPREEVSA